MQGVKWAVALSLLLGSLLASAAEIRDLYLAEVPADQSQQQWQQQALLQVLVKVSGQADVGEIPAIRNELRRASSYVKQFEAVRQQQQNRVRVLLDTVRVNQLLQQQQLPVWGAQRPETLLWIVEQTVSGERRFVRAASEPLLSALNQTFREKALPLTLPLYDIDDLKQLSETDVWAGFWQQVNQASTRYGADVILLVMIEHSTDGMRLNWQRQVNGRTFRYEASAADEAALMEQFGSQLAALLAQEYAVVFSQDGNTNKAVIEVSGLEGLTDLVTVQRALQQMLGVNTVTVTAYQNRTARFTLEMSLPAEELLKALQFERRLRQLDQDITPLPAAVIQPVQQEAVLAVYQYTRS